MDKDPWYNTTICMKLNGQSFKYYFKSERKDGYELMFYFDAYDKYYVSVLGGESSGSGRPMPSKSSKEALF